MNVLRFRTIGATASLPITHPRTMGTEHRRLRSGVVDGCTFLGGKTTPHAPRLNRGLYSLAEASFPHGTAMTQFTGNRVILLRDVGVHWGVPKVNVPFMA
jgi:hypothetical protein